MRRVLTSIVFVLVLVPALFAQRQNTFYATDFKALTVGQKVALAQAQCNASTQVPCYIVIDATLATWTSGTMPTKCPQCVWEDYRTITSSPWGSSSYILPVAGITLGGVKAPNCGSNSLPTAIDAFGNWSCLSVADAIASNSFSNVLVGTVDPQKATAPVVMVQQGQVGPNAGNVTVFNGWNMAGLPVIFSNPVQAGDLLVIVLDNVAGDIGSSNLTDMFGTRWQSAGCTGSANSYSCIFYGVPTQSGVDSFFSPDWRWGQGSIFGYEFKGLQPLLDGTNAGGTGTAGWVAGNAGDLLVWAGSLYRWSDSFLNMAVPGGWNAQVLTGVEGAGWQWGNFAAWSTAPYGSAGAVPLTLTIPPGASPDGGNIVAAFLGVAANPGKDGDYWLNERTSTLFGPKNGTWPTLGVVIGAGASMTSDTFASCSMSSVSSSDCACAGTAIWTNPRPDANYKVQCSPSAVTGSANKTNKTSFSWVNKTTTAFTYTITNADGGSCGHSVQLDCMAIE